MIYELALIGQTIPLVYIDTAKFKVSLRLLAVTCFCRMLMPISKLACLTPGYLLSTLKESSSKRRLKETSPRKCATEHVDRRNIFFCLFFYTDYLTYITTISEDIYRHVCACLVM